MLGTRRGLLLAGLVAALGLAVVGCGGGGDDGDGGDTGGMRAALPLEQRLLRAADLPGAQAGAIRTWTDAREFARDFRVFDPDQLTDRLERAGFVEAAGIDLTYPDGGKNAQSVAVRVGSPEDASAQVRWLEERAGSPCPPGCRVRARRVAIDGVPGARAVEVSASRRTVLGPPFESRFAVFADGPFVYMAFAFGRPTAVPEGEFGDAVAALYRRVEGRPPSGE